MVEDVIVEFLILVLILIKKFWLMIMGLFLVWLMLVGMMVCLWVILLWINLGVMKFWMEVLNDLLFGWIFFLVCFFNRVLWLRFFWMVIYFIFGVMMFCLVYLSCVMFVFFFLCSGMCLVWLKIGMVRCLLGFSLLFLGLWVCFLYVLILLWVII